MDLNDEALRTTVTRLVEKMKYMEGGHKWNSQANEKQYLHQMKVCHIVVEDFRMALEDHFGSRDADPPKLEAMVRKG